MRRWLGLAFLAAVLAWSPAVQAQNAPACTLLVDVSGSMNGYSRYEGQPLLKEIDRLHALCTDAWIFGDTPRRMEAGRPLVFRDLQTNIDLALKRWSARVPDNSFLVMLTDNISDNGGQSGDPTAEFYAALRADSSVYSHIDVIALRENFDGKLTDPTNKHRKSVPYRGPRALSLYLIGKNAPKDSADFKHLHAAVRRILGEMGHHEATATDNSDAAYADFDVAPFAVETFRVRSQAARIVTQSEDAGGDEGCSGEARFDAPTNTFLILGQPMDQSCTLKANLTVQFAARWCLVDAGLTATKTIQTDDKDILVGAVDALEVNPAVATLCADQKVLSVGIKFDALSFGSNVGFWDKLARTFTGSFNAEGTLIVRGTVRRENVYLERGLSGAWSYGSGNGETIDDVMSPDEKTQRKVFRLQEGVRAIIPGGQLSGYELARYPVKVEVLYDQAPLFAAIAIFLLALAVLAALIWFTARPKTIVIEDEQGGETTASLGLFGSAEAMSGDSLSLKVRNLALLLLASSTGRIVRGRFLGSAGGRVEVLPPGAAPLPRRRSRGRGEEDADFGGAPETEVQNAQAHVFTVRSISRARSAQNERNDDAF